MLRADCEMGKRRNERDGKVWQGASVGCEAENTRVNEF